MENTRATIKVTGVFLLLFSYGNISGTIDPSIGSNADQTTPKSVQTQTKTTQTTTKTTTPTTAKTTTQTGSKQTTTKTTTQTTTKTTTQATKKTAAPTGSKSTQTKTTKTATKSTPAKTNSTTAVTKPGTDKKSNDPGTVKIGTKTWAVANLNVNTFRNGDTIPEAKTNIEWETAGKSGKPAWCYYNNDPAYGQKFGKLYNWYAVNDPRGLAPDGWTLPGDADWGELAYYFNGQDAAGFKMKSSSGWNEGNNGTNESGFNGLPGGYRVENGTFSNVGSIGTWWSSTESKSSSAIDHYLSLSNSLGRSSNTKQRGESVRCIRK
jgi:uncharacterized protein (TIGR02145 family)